jgi:hypothetical protein
LLFLPFGYLVYKDLFCGSARLIKIPEFLRKLLKTGLSSVDSVQLYIGKYDRRAKKYKLQK